MTIELERTYRFSASHRYFRPEWSEEENLARFGRCAWAPGHGHNYRLTVWIAGEIDTATGFAVDLVALDAVVRERILDVVDHRHLNDVVAPFALGGIPTSENLASWAAERLGDALPAGCRLTRLRVAEDDDLAALWSAGEAGA
ncbi:MAG: 6-pyruvoyl trahydropterin synthase family protein [Candidatus Binatia bacterium]